MEGVLLPRKQFQFLMALPSSGLIMFVLQVLFGTSCLASPPLPGLQLPWHQTLSHHSCADAPLLQCSWKFSGNGHLSVPGMEQPGQGLSFLWVLLSPERPLTFGEVLGLPKSDGLLSSRP